jgi:two-component system NtrC family sensor kinase
MKLALKLTSAVMLVMMVVLTIHGYFVVTREADFFADDMEQHAYLVGRILSTSVADVWRTSGTSRVREIIRDADRSQRSLNVRWVFLGSVGADSTSADLDSTALSSLYRGKEIIMRGKNASGKRYLYAYFPVLVQNAPLSAIEVSQPMSRMYDYIKVTILQKLILFVATVVIGSLIVLVLGAAMVGRPVESMVRLAKKVSQGDLSDRVLLKKQHDELTELATGLNTMVTDLKKSQDRLQRETEKKIDTLEQLHHAERLATVGKLASGLAHELGTPLNVVSGRAKMIAAGDLKKDEIVESAQVIREQSDRVVKIIRQLLDFARRRSPEKKDADLKGVVEHVSAMLKPMAVERKIILKVASDGTPIKVKVDPVQIQQVLSNIVVNAIHAMPNGGQITLAVGHEHVQPPADRGREEGDYACVRVADQGVGISKENLNRIFTPFFSTKDIGEGTGLGLSIAHGIVTEHGGWMAVESEIGTGSTFCIYLPWEEE